MDIVIIAQYLSDLEHLEMTNGRFIYLAQMLKEKEENNVEIITTTFLHGRKKQAQRIPKEYMGCKITALYEPGYPKNVSLRRLYSHHKLANNVKEYLERRKKPDVIYTAVPSLAVAETAANYCKKSGVRFIVDIQDLWPEAFKMVFNVPVISSLIFEPMRRQANRIYAAADDIVAVSQTYADRGLKANKKCKEAKVVYLGTEKKIFDMWAKKLEKKSGSIKVVYIGSLGHSYDLKRVIEAMKTIKDKEYVELVVIGDGVLKEYFERHAREAGIHYEFTGMIPYPHMVEKLYSCDIAVNPIRKGSAGSVINKVSDYAMAGLPVVNTQESKEYRELLEEYGAGINCECENVESIAKALLTLVQDKKLREAMSKNSRRLGVDKFDRNSTYEKVVNDAIYPGRSKNCLYRNAEIQ